MDPKVGRFTAMDPWKGVASDPMSLHRYLYAHLNPVSNVDPSGLMTLAEIQVSDSIKDILQAIRTESSREIRNAAFRRLGQIAQQQVEKLAKEVLEEIVEELLLDGINIFPEGPETVRYDGAKKRVLDFHVTAGKFIADIEVKYGIPKRGSEAMKRLISQVRSMKRGPNARRILVIMSENVSDAALERLKRSVRGGRAGPFEVLNGAGDVVDFFRRFFIR